MLVQCRLTQLSRELFEQSPQILVHVLVWRAENRGVARMLELLLRFSETLRLFLQFRRAARAQRSEVGLLVGLAVRHGADPLS